MSRESLSLFFDRACATSLCIMFFFIPISSAAVESLSGLSFLFYLGSLAVCRGFFLLHFKREKIILLFFVTLSFSLVNSAPFLPISLRALFAKWLQYIFIYLIVTRAFSSTRRIKLALAVISSAAVLVIIDCYWQLLFNLEFLRHRSMAWHGNDVFALTGPFSHNNALAAYLVCALIIILYWVLFGRSRVVRIASGVVFLSGIFLLPFSYSRGSYLSFVAGMFLLLFLLKRPLILSALFIATLISGLKFSLLKSFAFKDAGRFELWGVSIRMIKEHPLIGNGIGTFMAWFRNFSPAGEIKYAHNCFLQLWAEAGIVALSAFVFFVLKTLYDGLQAFKKTEGREFLFVFCAITAYLMNSLFDNNLFSLQLAVLFWVLMGLLKGYILSVGSQRCA